MIQSKVSKVYVLIDLDAKKNLYFFKLKKNAVQVMNAATEAGFNVNVESKEYPSPRLLRLFDDEVESLESGFSKKPTKSVRKPAKEHVAEDTFQNIVPLKKKSPNASGQNSSELSKPHRLPVSVSDLPKKLEQFAIDNGYSLDDVGTLFELYVEQVLKFCK